jgi:hypothetical protein
VFAAVVALSDTTRVTYNAFEYDRKSAAAKNVSWFCHEVLANGLPKREASSSSDVIRMRSLVGPQRNTPAIAAGGVATAGITAVASTSLTMTDGLTEKTIFFSFFVRFVYKFQSFLLYL